MSDIENNEDPDPIKASYDVFIKPQISADRHIYILQFPNRDSKQHYSAANQSQPLKLRIKEQAGMVELDVPIDAYRNYDQDKGIKWGQALKKSNAAKGGGSHGLPGGFGIGGAQATVRGRGKGEADDEAELQLLQQEIEDDYDGTVKREQVLTRQTLGGLAVVNDEMTPQYMIGAFRKNQLHLTPVSHMVQMRPQFHHLDAAAEQERLARPRDAALPARVAEARAVHMTVKTVVDGEEETTDTMAERITAMQIEPWKSHRYVDEDSAEAWDGFHENLFVDAGDENEDLQAKVPNLVSALSDKQYLDAISAPRDAARLSRSKKVNKNVTGQNEKGKEKADGEDSSNLSDTTDSES